MCGLYLQTLAISNSVEIRLNVKPCCYCNNEADCGESVVKICVVNDLWICNKCNHSVWGLIFLLCNILGQTEWIVVVCWQLEHMRATKEDKLRRLAEMKAARLLHRSLEGKRACELLKSINKSDERERSGLFILPLFCFLVNSLSKLILR